MTNPAPANSNPTKACSEREALEKHGSGSADGGVVAGSWPEKSADPEQIERSELCQQEVDRLVTDILARTRRLEELMRVFKHSVIPLRITDGERFSLMRSGNYLTSLWTRNEHNL